MVETTLPSDSIERSAKAAPSVVLLIAALLLITAVAYWPTSAALYGYWTRPYTGGEHGIVVGIIVIWLLYRARGRIAAAPIRPVLPLTLLVCLGGVCSMIFWKAGIQELHILLLPALLWFAVVAAFGIAVGRVVMVPVAYLYFAVPAWSAFAEPLQKLTLLAMGFIAPLVGLPVAIDGTLVTFPNGTAFEVARACSGLTFLVQGLAVAALIGELERASLTRRMALMAAMVIFALITNWIRVLALIDVGYRFGVSHSFVWRDHLLFGWVVFVAALLIFVWIATRGSPSRSSEPVPAASRAPGALLTLRPYFATAGALALAPALVYALAVLRTSHQAVAAEVSTGTAPGWNGSLASPKSTEWRPVFIGTHSERHMVYVDGGGERIEAFQIGYPSQEQGRELVNEGNSLLGNGGLQASGDHVVRTATGTYNEIVATDSQGNQSVVWSDYEIGGKPFVTPVLSQLWYGLRALADPPYSALLAYRSACKPSCDAARDRLKRLLEPSGALFTGQNQVRPERDSGTQHGRRYESGAQGLESTS